MCEQEDLSVIPEDFDFGDDDCFKYAPADQIIEIVEDHCPYCEKTHYVEFWYRNSIATIFDKEVPYMELTYKCPCHGLYFQDSVLNQCNLNTAKLAYINRYGNDAWANYMQSLLGKINVSYQD